MDSPGAVGRRRGNSRINAEDQALDQIAKETSANPPPPPPSSSKKMKAICYTQPPPEVCKPPARLTTTVAQQETSTIVAGRSGPWSVEPAIEEICTDPNQRVLDGQSGQWVVKKRKKVNKKDVVGKIAAAFIEAIMQNYEESSDEEDEEDEEVDEVDEAALVPAASTPEKVQHADSSLLALTAAPDTPRNQVSVRAKKRRLSPYLGEPAVATSNEDEPCAMGQDDQVD